MRQEFGSHIGLSGIQYTILISIAHLQGDQGVGVNAVQREANGVLFEPLNADQFEATVALSKQLLGSADQALAFVQYLTDNKGETA